MNIKRAKEEIVNTVKAYSMKDEAGRYRIPAVRQRPVLLIGPPGIGKTAIMEQAANECGISLVSYTMTHHTRQSALGLPFIEKREFQGRQYSVTEYTMSEIIASVYDKIETTGIEQGILFIDEINCVSETLAPVMLQFLQMKAFGNARVPEGWVIVAAGNPPEYNRSVREFDVVTLDRIKLIQVEADYQAWKKYAYQKNLHGAILSYLEMKQDKFYHIETTVDGKNFVTPRGWEDLSNLITVYERMKLKVDSEVTVQYLQDRKTAVDFANYLELYYRYDENYNINGILNGEWNEKLVSRIKKAAFDERISVVELLLSRLNTEFMNNFRYDALVTEIYGVLKGFHKEIQENPDQSPVSLFEGLLRKKSELYEKKKENSRFEQEQELLLSKVIEELRKFHLLLSEKYGDDADAFEIVRGEFEKLQKNRESMIKDTKNLLEHAFGFLEDTFGQGSELLLFVTELSAGFYSLAFIRENGSESFFRYHEMVGDNGREAILEEVNKLSK